ncbi:MAG: hypothetical protein ACOYXC_13870 [Candidatus Rifleibacteriota bacterium]
MNKPSMQKRGIAIAVVLVFCVAILGLVTVLVMNTRFHKGSHNIQFEQTRALMAAKAAMQLAIYKFRVLPSEFYKLHEIEKLLRANPGDPLLINKLKAFEDIWNMDFDSDVPGSPADKINQRLNSIDQVDANNRHSFKVPFFKLVSRKNKGYVKDFIQIRSSGKYGNSEKVLEELIEVTIAH